MRKIVAAIGLAVVLAVPAGAMAKPDGTEKHAAVKQCKAERAADRAALTEKYGTNRNKKKAFGKCVSRTKAKNLEIAAKECAAERGEIGADAFAEKYGTNHTKRNAFGKCVSGKSRAS